MDVDFWLDGVTATIIVAFGLISSIIFLVKYKNTKAELLRHFAYISPLAGLLYLGVCLDFWFVLLQNENLPNSWGQVALLSYIWFPPLMYFIINFNLDMLNVEKKKKILLPFILVSIVYYILIFQDPFTAFYMESPETPGEGLIDYNSSLESAAGLILALLFIPILLYLALLFFKKGMKASGVIKRKLLLLAGACILFCIGGIGEGLTIPGGLLILVRIAYIGSFVLLFYGFRSRE